jgi:hypothetical protein
MIGLVSRGELQPFNLLFTSPPYFSVTNYNYDQWLRQWMLGGDSHPVRTRGVWQSKFQSRTAYRTLLETVFRDCAALLSRSATIYVRTDARQFTYETTLAALQLAFPERELDIAPRPFKRSTQTALFGDKSEKPGEVDIILR